MGGQGTEDGTNHRDTETQSRQKAEKENSRESDGNRSFFLKDSLLVFSVALCLCG
jgi:hypothetical protein